MTIIHPIIKLFFIVTFTCLAAAAWATPEALSQATPEQKQAASQRWLIQHWKTPSGTPVYFIENHVLPIVDIQVVFRAGSAYDGQQFGLANLTNSLLNQGTQQASAEQIAEQWDLAGATYNVNANRDMAIVGMRSVTYPKQFTLALSTLQDILTHPTFPVDAFERLRKQTIQMLTYQEQNPDLVTANLFYHTLYGQHPYGHLTLGTSKTLAALTSEAVRTFYQRYYTANNAIVAIVGNFTLEEAKKVSAELTTSLGKGPAAEKVPPPTKNGSHTQHIAFPSNQTHLLMGQIALSRADPDYYALTVANHILGGLGLTSRLFKAIREERGLAYQVASFFAPLQEEGPFYIKLQTENSQKQQAVDLANKVLKEFMDKGPTQAELDSSKHHLIQSYILKLSSNQATLLALIDIAFYGLPLDYLSTYQTKIQAVTDEDIQKALKKHLAPERFVSITVGKDG